MSLCCDKDCERGSTILVVLIFASLFTGYFCPNKIVKGVCMLLTIILLIILLIVQNGGYEQFVQTDEDTDKIKYMKTLLKGIVPDCYLDLPVVSSSESYTFKKKKIFLCIKHFDYNTLLYVYLHELAHAMTPPESDPHSSTWRKNFDELLAIASKAGIYDSKVGIDNKYMEYCGEQ